jgi:hypothetical protein
MSQDSEFQSVDPPAPVAGFSQMTRDTAQIVTLSDGTVAIDCHFLPMNSALIGTNGGIEILFLA